MQPAIERKKTYPKQMANILFFTLSTTTSNRKIANASTAKLEMIHFFKYQDSIYPVKMLEIFEIIVEK